MKERHSNHGHGHDHHHPNHHHHCGCKNPVELLFEVERELILHTAKLDSYYVGEVNKNNAPLPATKMQAHDDNDDVLNGFIDSAAGVVNDVMTGLLSSVDLRRERYITEKKFESIRFEFYVTVPPTFDANQNTAILTAIKDVMVSYTLWKWYKITNPAIQQQYHDEMENAKMNLQHRLNQRTRPVRRRVRPLGF